MSPSADPYVRTPPVSDEAPTKSRNPTVDSV